MESRDRLFLEHNHRPYDGTPKQKVAELWNPDLDQTEREKGN